jgi:hypothetical protein
MARGKGEVSKTDADFRAAEKAVRTGDAAVPVGASSRALSGAGVRFDPQQKPFLLATVQRADEMAERRQRGQRQRQQPSRQRLRQQPSRQLQRQQPGRQQQDEEEEEEEGEEEGEEEAMVQRAPFQLQRAPLPALAPQIHKQQREEQEKEDGEQQQRLRRHEEVRHSQGCNSQSGRQHEEARCSQDCNCLLAPLQILC